MSTQTLTELPRIQKTGMDFESVVEEIQNIIADNPNWRSNWNEFRDSEAGAMLIELFAWITDNFTTRQDLLFNEMFIGTAQDDRDKVRHLKQIGYIPKMPHSAKVPIRITFAQSTNDKIIITKKNSGNLLLRPSNIASFKSSDINGVNGEEIYWEILKVRDGKPDYLEEVTLNPGKIEYEQNSTNENLFALQGKTKCEEFQISTKDGSFFTLKEKNIASDSIQVYLGTYERLLQVKSFISSEALDENNPIPYVVELNEDRTYNIRFANKDIAKENKLIKAGQSIFVFYRTCDGEIGNIKPGIISASLSCTTESGSSTICQVTNDFPAVGGSNVEKLTDAVMNGPLSLTTMDRAVTPNDYNIILRNNTNVYKAKTYTSSNQPEGFKDYYGRFINPQESFTFLMTNKNHKGVPTEKYNNFPWLTMIREPRINEKYIFDKGKFNDKINIKGKSYNLQVTYGGSAKLFNNATIMDVGELFNSGLYIDEKNPNKQLQLKLNNEITKELFLNKVPFGLFSQKDTTSIIDMSNNKTVVYNDNAKFITKDAIDLEEPIDIKNSRYLNFEMDNGAFEALKIDLAGEDEKEIDNLSHYYLKWSNKKIDPPKDLPGDGKEISNYRSGIVEIINQSINNANSGSQDFRRNAGLSKQPFGLSKSENENINFSADKHFSLKFKANGEINDRIYIFKSPENPSFTLADFKDYLSRCFQSPEDCSVKKYQNDLSELDTGDISFLKNYKVDIQKSKKNNFNSAESSVFVMDNINVSQIFKYDMYIYTEKKSEVLCDFEYTYEGIKYNVENAIYVEDPETPVLISEETEEPPFEQIKGLFQILSGAETPVNRINQNIPNVYPECEYKDLAEIIEEENGNRFMIKSPLKGPISSLYFKSNDIDNDFSKNILNVPYDKDGKESFKVFGQKKACLVYETPTVIQNIVEDEPINNTSLNINLGNIIFENSCFFNDYDFKDIYASYKLKSLDSIKLGSSYDNFYFTGDKLKDDKLKSDVKGILGQKVDHVKVNNKDMYFIDEDKSNYNIKLTKDYKDTNSLFAINDDLGAICKSYVTLKSNSLENYSTKSVEKYSLHFGVDDNDNVTLDLDLSSVKNGESFIDSLRQASITAVNNKVKGAAYIRDNLDSIFKLYYRNDKMITINSISKYDGVLTFDISDNPYEDYIFYKWLFGTNKTNPDFYDLHNYIGENNRKKVGENADEYYYCPVTDYPLTFHFRKMVDGASRSADYTIVTESQSENGSCSFYLKKEENGNFPDNYFYVHFINDKSYDYDDKGLLKETDESIFQKYMNKSKISGTDITFLQPYFKTYDIEATVGYNSDFTSSSEIKSKIEKAINDLCSLDKAQIGGKITKSEINYVIRSCEGVAELTIDYLGYNALDKENNEDLEAIVSPFYSISCIHETTEEGRGLKLILKSI